MQLVEGISGRTAVVTGAAQGIGRNIADLLVANGAKTAYLDLNKPSSFTESSSQKFFQCNVTELQSIENAFTDIDGFNQPSPSPRYSITKPEIKHNARQVGIDLDEICNEFGLSKAAF